LARAVQISLAHSSSRTSPRDRYDARKWPDLVDVEVQGSVDVQVHIEVNVKVSDWRCD
jgi:hypothetical protein